MVLVTVLCYEISVSSSNYVHTAADNKNDSLNNKTSKLGYSNKKTHSHLKKQFLASLLMNKYFIVPCGIIDLLQKLVKVSMM